MPRLGERAHNPSTPSARVDSRISQRGRHTTSKPIFPCSLTILASHLTWLALSLNFYQVILNSTVAHSPTYLLSRFSHNTTAFYDNSSSIEVLIGHVFTHRDGSLGTLHVAPPFRHRGIGDLLMKYRAAAREGELPFAYVSEDNTASLSVMRKLGWTDTWGVFWAGVGREGEET